MLNPIHVRVIQSQDPRLRTSTGQVSAVSSEFNSLILTRIYHLLVPRVHTHALGILTYFYWGEAASLNAGSGMENTSRDSCWPPSDLLWSVTDTTLYVANSDRSTHHPVPKVPGIAATIGQRVQQHFFTYFFHLLLICFLHRTLRSSHPMAIFYSNLSV